MLSLVTSHMSLVTCHCLKMATKKRDYYEVLGVARNAPDEEINRAYRKLAFVTPSGVEESRIIPLIHTTVPKVRFYDLAYAALKITAP
jgi:hypothetical protein